MKLGDPAFVHGMDALQKYMLDPTEEESKRRTIDDTVTHDPSFYDPDMLEQKDTPGTSQICVTDKDGMTVSMTTTINLIFGSRIMDPKTGVIMNNQL
jgi:gamma-glutamyltranspeptidase/glutathione hydrolase